MTDPATDVELDLLPQQVAVRRGLLVGGAGLLVAAALGVLVGLLLDRFSGIIVGVVLGIPLLLLGLGETRRRTWLRDGLAFSRSAATRAVDLRTATRLELLVTALRGRRTVVLVAAGPPSGRAVSITLAAYDERGGLELGIVALRALADVLQSGDEATGLVYAELLVAQLRAEAREEGLDGRPFHQLAAHIPAGHLTHRITPEQLSATLD
jgi:hypothetical protein